MGLHIKLIISSIFITSFILYSTPNSTFNNDEIYYSIKCKINIDENLDSSRISNWKDYHNKDYHISLKYPSFWKSNPSYSNRYDGKDGFFQISAISAKEMSIDKITEFDAYHMSNPYGSSPQIKKLKVQGQEARLIIPSSDQSKEMLNQVEIIIKYPTAVKIGNETYYYFILWADKNHIQEIIKTIKFTKV